MIGIQKSLSQKYTFYKSFSYTSSNSIVAERKYFSQKYALHKIPISYIVLVHKNILDEPLEYVCLIHDWSLPTNSQFYGSHRLTVKPRLSLICWHVWKTLQFLGA